MKKNIFKKFNKKSSSAPESALVMPAKSKIGLKISVNYYVTSLLVLLFLISVGFASWVTMGGASAQSAFGGFYSSPVLNVDDYLTVGTFTSFEYCESGFVVNGATNYNGDAYDGIVTLNYGIKEELDSLKDQNFVIEFTLYGTQANGDPLTIFPYTNTNGYQLTAGADLTVIETDIQVSVSSDNEKLLVSFALNSIVGYDSFSLSIPFSGDSFVEHIKPQIQAIDETTCNLKTYVKIVKTN